MATEALLLLHRSDARLLMASLARHYHYTQQEIGKTLGVGRTAVAMIEQISQDRQENDPAYFKQ